MGGFERSGNGYLLPGADLGVFWCSLTMGHTRSGSITQYEIISEIIPSSDYLEVSMKTLSQNVWDPIEKWVDGGLRRPLLDHA